MAIFMLMTVLSTRLDILRSYALPGMLTVLVAYLLGSLNFGIIFSWLFKRVDVRDYGSGNAGATNVLRSVGKVPALLTFLFDFLKCVASVLLGRLFFVVTAVRLGDPQILCAYGAYFAGLFCLLGHCYPLFFGLRGGKGVTTAAAMIAVIDWRIFLGVLAVFLIVYLLGHYVSLASICAAGSTPVFTFLITFFLDCAASPLAVHAQQTLVYVHSATVCALILGIFVIVRHSENIKRLRQGTEKKMYLHRRHVQK